MKLPLYTRKPIARMESLAKVAGLTHDELISLASKADFSYDIQKRVKPNGSYREISAPNKKLKNVQKRIVEQIFCHVEFPNYLQGSVKSLDSRNDITNAAMHTRKSLLIRMDIENFFPSVSEQFVFNIWKSFFRFPDKTADLLTKLTTYNGYLPQGVPTSSGLANLIFWDREPMLVSSLQAENLTYTRYVDDITISSLGYRNTPELNTIFAQVFGMFASKGLKANRNKTLISTNGHRQTVHNLNVNGDSPSMTKKDRSKVRAAVKECEDVSPAERIGPKYEELWGEIHGRVQRMFLLHRNESIPYLKRLDNIRPILDQDTFHNMSCAVELCEKQYRKDCQSKQYNKLYRQTQHQIPKTLYLFPDEQSALQKRLNKVTPR